MDCKLYAVYFFDICCFFVIVQSVHVVRLSRITKAKVALVVCWSGCSSVSREIWVSFFCAMFHLSAACSDVLGIAQLFFFPLIYHTFILYRSGLIFGVVYCSAARFPGVPSVLIVLRHD